MNAQTKSFKKFAEPNDLNMENAKLEMHFISDMKIEKHNYQNLCMDLHRIQ